MTDTSPHTQTDAKTPPQAIRPAVLRRNSRAVALAVSLLVPCAGLAQGGITPPTEVTPEIIALRGCVEGVSHPSGQALSVEDQGAACDDHVALAEDTIGAIYFRGLHFFDNGMADAHRAQAFDDFSRVIDAGGDVPSAAYANRAWLHVRHLGDADAALADIDSAIALAAETPRSGHFQRRAYILTAQAERDNEPALIKLALDDLDRALALRPDSRTAQRMRDALTGYLRDLR